MIDANVAHFLVISTDEVHRLVMNANSLVQVFLIGKYPKFYSAKNCAAEKYTILLLFLPIPPLFSCLIPTYLYLIGHYGQNYASLFIGGGLSWFKTLDVQDLPVYSMYAAVTSTPSTIVTVYATINSIPVIETNVFSVVGQLTLSDLGSLTLEVVIHTSI